MKFKNYFFLTALCLAVSLLSTAPAQAETTTPLIAVMKKNDIASLLNAAGEQVGQTTFYFGETMRAFQAIPIDITSEPGIEWVYYNNGFINIADQGTTITLDSFPVLNQGTNAAITVGDLLSDYAGPEIAICETYAATPHIDVYSYAADTGASLVETFDPWGSGSKHYRGCGSMAIGNVDEDSESEIVIVKDNRKKVRIFNNTGQQTGGFEYTGRSFMNSEDDQLLLADIYGTGIKKIVMNYSPQHAGLGVLSDTGEEILDFDWNNVLDSGKEIDSFTVSDVDNDGKEEIIIQADNKKGKTFVVDGTGNVQAQFSAFPNETSRKNNYMFVAPFSY